MSTEYDPTEVYDVCESCDCEVDGLKYCKDCGLQLCDSCFQKDCKDHPNPDDA